MYLYVHILNFIDSIHNSQYTEASDSLNLDVHKLQPGNVIPASFQTMISRESLEMMRGLVSI